MSILAWILSGMLAATFLGAGLAKLATPYDKLVTNPRMGWATDFSGQTVKIIGTLEVLGAIGVILPWLTGIAPVLTSIAALGLGGVMIGALVTHSRRGEIAQALPVNGVLLALALAVAIIRFSQL